MYSTYGIPQLYELGTGTGAPAASVKHFWADKSSIYGGETFISILFIPPEFTGQRQQLVHVNAARTRAIKRLSHEIGKSRYSLYRYLKSRNQGDMRYLKSRNQADRYRYSLFVATELRLFSNTECS